MTTSEIFLLIACSTLFGLCGYLLYKLKDYNKHMLELYDAREEVRKLKYELDRCKKGRETLEELVAHEEATPKGCKRGEWCGACQFGKILMVYSGYGHYDAYNYCTQAECCDYFVQREAPE